jgi:hypothetical protein
MRQCYFCGKEIAAHDPPEHVIPKWMRKLRPPGTWFFTGPPVTLQGESTNPAPVAPGGFSKGPEIKTDVVCKDCNGGWLSDLETRASNLLPPILAGDSQTLPVGDQAFLAVWAIKTAMMWQTVPPNERPDRTGGLPLPTGAPRTTPVIQGAYRVLRRHRAALELLCPRPSSATTGTQSQIPRIHTEPCSPSENSSLR